MKRVYLHTFGCKTNQYDTEVVRQALQTAGVMIVDEPADADLAVVNSCTVTHVAEAKMRRLVRHLGRAGTETVVMGCAAALDDGKLARLPGVRDVVPGADPARVLRAFDLPFGDTNPVLRRFDRTGRAWLKIQDGCDEHCTFCATTLARGDNRSRSIDEIVLEARALAEWHAEIVLTGVHIGTYGNDRDGESLGALVERLVADVPGVRFRLSSIEATEVDDRLAELLIGAPRHVAPHLHAPLQSGSDRVLKRMGRHWYTARRYRERLEWLAERLPCFGLGADVITGFPGETAADHAETLGVIEALPFTYLHVFPYSERPGAAARKLGRPVSPPIVAERSAELRRIAAQKAEAHRAARAGAAADVVLIGHHGGRAEGLTEDYLTVYLPTDVQTPRFAARITMREGALGADPILKDELGRGHA